MIKYFFFICLFLFSGLLFADSYPAVDVPSSTAQWTCAAYLLTDSAGNNYCLSYGDTHYPGAKKITTPHPSRPDLYFPKVEFFPISHTCPYGGTLSGTTCINAPSCPAPQQRNSVGVCYTPKTCIPPEIDNGFGICSVKECMGGQVNNSCTGQCQTKPTCAAAETYDNCSNSCKLWPLHCPFHSHANTANDACLPDPALTCPIGQHDDGTYNCVADDAPTPCNSNQQKGWINGIPQCINKPNLDTAQQAAADAAAAAKAAALDAAAKKTASDAAAATAAASAAAAAADPTNQAKQDQAASDAAAASSAASNSSNAADTAASDKAAADAADNDAKNAYLKTIADEAKAAADRAAGRKGASSNTCATPPACEGDAVDCALLNQTWLNNCKGLDPVGPGDIPDKDSLTPVSKTLPTLDSGGSGASSGSCPAAQTFVIQGTTMTLSYRFICDYAEAIKYLVIALAWLGAGFIVFGSKG
jgi:hypothetical protein